MHRGAIFIICLSFCGPLTGCMTTGGEGGSSARAGAYAAPPNYRQLVARKVIEGTAHIGPIRSATISRPTDRFVGLLGGGSRPIVCATATNDGRFIQQVTHWLFMFENGKIASVAVNPGAIYCAGVPDGPFPEVVRRG